MRIATCTSCKHWGGKCEGDAKAACDTYEMNDDDDRKELAIKYLLGAYEKINDIVSDVNEGVGLYEEGYEITRNTSDVLETHASIVDYLISVRAKILDMMVAMGPGVMPYVSL